MVITHKRISSSFTCTWAWQWADPPHRDPHSQAGTRSTSPLHASPRITVNKWSVSVLRIRDILVRVRIRGSLTLTNGSGSGSRSCYFHYCPSRRQQKTIFFSKFFCSLLLKVHLRHFSKISHKEVRSGSGSIPLTDEPDPGGLKTYRTDPTIRIRNTGGFVCPGRSRAVHDPTSKFLPTSICM